MYKTASDVGSRGVTRVRRQQNALCAPAVLCRAHSYNLFTYSRVWLKVVWFRQLIIGGDPFLFHIVWIYIFSKVISKLNQMQEIKEGLYPL